jgi:hypothetical protein
MNVLRNEILNSQFEKIKNINSEILEIMEDMNNPHILNKYISILDNVFFDLNKLKIMMMKNKICNDENINNREYNEYLNEIYEDDDIDEIVNLLKPYLMGLLILKNGIKTESNEKK